MVNFRPQPTREFVQQYVSQIYSKIKKSLDHILKSFCVQNRITAWTWWFYYPSLQIAQFHGVDYPIGESA